MLKCKNVSDRKMRKVLRKYYSTTVANLVALCAKNYESDWGLYMHIIIYSLLIYKIDFLSPCLNCSAGTLKMCKTI